MTKQSKLIRGLCINFPSFKKKYFLGSLPTCVFDHLYDAELLRRLITFEPFLILYLVLILLADSNQSPSQRDENCDVVP